MLQRLKVRGVSCSDISRTCTPFATAPETVVETTATPVTTNDTPTTAETVVETTAAPVTTNDTPATALSDDTTIPSAADTSTTLYYTISSGKTWKIGI